MTNNSELKNKMLIECEKNKPVKYIFNNRVTYNIQNKKYIFNYL